ncbi:MAG: hypothetical protein AAFY52_03555 [Pseudomonadota bacterium]
MKRAVLAILCLGLSGCALLEPRNPPFEAEPEAQAEVDAAGTDTPEDLIRPEARPESAERKPEVSAGALGRTVASLGNAAEPGLWIKTPLVRAEREGRVFYAETGKTVAVRLIPIDGPASAGSRLSLEAMRALGAPLTGLPEVDVLAG